MQIELTLNAPEGADYSARDLGYLLHKHPDHLHERDTGAGTAYIFFSEKDDAQSTAVLYLDIDAVELVRGKNKQSDGLLEQYVNDRPFVANSFMSVALGRSFAQTIAGKSKDRQALADRKLPLKVRIVPVALAGDEETVHRIFQPLGYDVEMSRLASAAGRVIYDLTLSGELRLADLLSHIYVLVPVLDNAKHYWVDRDEVEKLLDKAGPWLADHPEKELITRRALKHRRALVNSALEKLIGEEEEPDNEDVEQSRKGDAEQELEKPIRLHELRLDTVLQLLKDEGAKSVLDLGCGEGKLLKRLINERGTNRIVGVDAAVRTLEIAADRLHLTNAGEAMRERVKLQLGSLTYGDRRWRDFDAATLVEVIEHIDPPRLSALEQSLFGFARPRLVVITTPNREYNALFEKMEAGAMRHSDHRFEWTREEFMTWCTGVAERNDYSYEISPLGPVDDTHGAPSQMAVFRLQEAT